MHPGGKMSQKNRIAILELMKQPGNNTCADCGTPNPEWASASKGLFICITCSGIHRNIRDHSKSLRLDTWTDEKLKFMEENGNEKGNAIWAKKVPLCYRRPKPTDPRVLREQWIRAKYEREEFIADAPQPPYLSGSMRGRLWKREKDDNTWNQRIFVLSEAENKLCYYINEKDREPKQSLRLTDINVTFAEERTNKENSLQITCVTDGRTRNYFVHEDGKVIVDWYMAIRSAKLNILRKQEPYVSVETLADHLTRDFTKEGFLEKRGPKGEPFQKRWFTLDHRRLLYFKRPLDAFAKGELILGSHEEGFKVQEGVSYNQDRDDEDYCFTLTTPERNYILKANTENERRMWMACLSEVISQPMTDEDKHEMKVTLEAATKNRGSSLRRFRGFSHSKDDDSP